MKPFNTSALTLGAVLLSAASLTVQAGSNPFAAVELNSGYNLAQADKTAEGRCGEGKCAAQEKSDSEGKCGEGKCGADGKTDSEGKCGSAS